MNPEPLFLLSLPRSGSTVFQRMLAGHPDLDTASEPWVMLPLAEYLREPERSRSYAAAPAQRAFSDFADGLSGGRDELVLCIREFALSLYQSRSIDSARFFIDKTPRYHLILEPLSEIFPKAPQVILWRNPLAVAASILRRWSQEGWNLPYWDIDLRVGLARLVQYSANRPDIMTVRYEDLMDNPDEVCNSVFERIGVSSVGARLEDSPSLSGQMGDLNLAVRNAVHSERSTEWPDIFCNPLRCAWAHRYIDWVGDSRLSHMGYSRSELLHQLHSVPMTRERMLSDAWRMPTFAVREAVRDRSDRRSWRSPIYEPLKR